jgi:5-formyltetrahydrofolate cyclo-ligase
MSLPHKKGFPVDEKHRLRAEMRALRREHVAALPDSTRALLFLRPPGPIAALAPEGAVVGLYHALANEAPARSYAKWFSENGRTVALPWFADRAAPMRFRVWRDPYADEGLEPGPLGHIQPRPDAEEVTPDLVFVPLLAFTARGERLGQGGGHYDQWLAAYPQVLPIGLAWDCQLVDALPIEPHDRLLGAVVTPTRLYEGEG